MKMSSKIDLMVNSYDISVSTCSVSMTQICHGSQNVVTDNNNKTWL